MRFTNYAVDTGGVKKNLCQQSKGRTMLGEILGASIGEKLIARAGRGANGALLDAGTVTLARRSGRPLAMLIAANHGLKLPNDYRKKQRTLI